jgi:hypothetical protein
MQQLLFATLHLFLCGQVLNGDVKLTLYYSCWFIIVDQRCHLVAITTALWFSLLADVFEITCEDLSHRSDNLYRTTFHKLCKVCSRMT